MSCNKCILAFFQLNFCNTLASRHSCFYNIVYVRIETLADYRTWSVYIYLKQESPPTPSPCVYPIPRFYTHTRAIADCFIEVLSLSFFSLKFFVILNNSNNFICTYTNKLISGHSYILVCSAPLSVTQNPHCAL